MPTRKKTTTAEAALPAGEVKTATRRTAAKPAAEAAAKVPAKPRKAAASSEKPAKPEKSAAATHKSPAKRAAAPAPKSAPAFDVEAHRAEIEMEAYFLWERRGRVHGSSHEDWWSAVEIVRARHQQ